jgi:hypothetical protein
MTNPSQTSPAIVTADTQSGRTLPAVTNPSQTLPATVAAAANGGRIGRAASVAVGRPLAARGAMGAGSIVMAREGDLADRAQASVEEQRVRGYFMPRLCMEVELHAEDPQLQRLINANSTLCSVYGDTIH